MNYGMVRNIVGKIMLLVAALMCLPLFVSIISKDESFIHCLAFLIPMTLLILFGILLCYRKPVSLRIGGKEGFVIVSLSWIVMSLFGCLPFIISKQLPNFFDAFFEISSGFSTTGASVATDIESWANSMLFWRSFSHWIGGMGVLVFVLAFIPESDNGSAMHILRAESPGPQVGKLVSKMKATSRILYLIYMGMTLIQILLLWFGPDEKMSLFRSVIYTFGTAGTGGFSMDSTGLEFYSSYSQYVIAIFMILFGINFTIYYLMLIGNWREVYKNEEVRTYLIIVFVAVAIICGSLLALNMGFEEAFRKSLFQVASIISTTGFSTTNFDLWPEIAKIVIIILMVCGACAGSTAGGVKTSRIIILVKSTFKKVKSMISPRKVESIKMNGEVVDEKVVEGVQGFIVMYLLVFVFCALLISIDGQSTITNITASLSCISNIGPGLDAVGPYGSFAVFSNFSKFVLSLEMIAGRLEIFPLLALFYPGTWKRR